VDGRIQLNSFVSEGLGSSKYLEAIQVRTVRFEEVFLYK